MMSNDARAGSSTLGAFPAPAPPAPAHPRLLVATTILASSLAFIDGSVVNVGLPTIGRALGSHSGDLSWVVNGYLLPLSALLLIGGACGDAYGRRRLLMLGILLFAAASTLCSLAPNLEFLVAGRVLQGIGAATLMPNSLATLGANFSGEARGRAVGIWAGVGAAFGAIGPLVGGTLLDHFGWRLIFLINLPIAATAVLLALRYVPADLPRARAPLDLVGALLAAASLAAITWALTLASSGRATDGRAGLAAVAGAALLALFWWAQRRRGETAMVPLSLFSSPRFVGLTLLTLLLYGALGMVLVLVPTVLIGACGYSSTLAGAALLPLPVIIALSSAQMGRLAGRFGSRLLLTIGPAVAGLGFLLLLRIGPGSYWTMTLPAMLVIAIGMGTTAAPLTTAVLGSVDAQRTGVASGLNSAVARLGSLVATALASGVLAAHGENLLHRFHVAALLAAAAGALASGCAVAYLGARRD